jgi:typhasterol/6-deoxotyphasterol 2alpha-hydroxylase
MSVRMSYKSERVTPPLRLFKLHSAAASMELSPPFSVVTFLALAIAAAFILRKLKAKSGRVYNLPPGPTPWPVIGNFTTSSARSRTAPSTSSPRSTARSCTSASSRSFPVIIGSSVDLARYFLKTHDLLFVELFSARRLASLEHIRADEVRALVRGLLAASGLGRAVHLNRDHLSTLSMNVITRMVLGKRFFGAGAADAPEGPVSSLAGGAQVDAGRADAPQRRAQRTSAIGSRGWTCRGTCGG